MNDKRIIKLEEFRKVVQELAVDTKNEFPKLYFDYAEMIPVYDKTFRYGSTPINTITFATTGGNGIH